MLLLNTNRIIIFSSYEMIMYSNITITYHTADMYFGKQQETHCATDDSGTEARRDRL